MKMFDVDYYTDDPSDVDYKKETGATHLHANAFFDICMFYYNAGYTEVPANVFDKWTVFSRGYFLLYFQDAILEFAPAFDFDFYSDIYDDNYSFQDALNNAFKNRTENGFPVFFTYGGDVIYYNSEEQFNYFDAEL